MKPITPALRWTLFGLLCVAGIFNAMDRPVIAILKPDMSADLGWSDSDFANLAFVTQSPRHYPSSLQAGSSTRSAFCGR